MNGSIAAIITLGFGTFGSVGLTVTVGYGSGTAVTPRAMFASASIVPRHLATETITPKHLATLGVDP